MRIFFSHSSKNKPLVREIKSHLPTHVKGWLDEQEILLGDDVSNSIKSAIATESDFLIVFLDQNSIKSSWVKKELLWAFEYEKIISRSFILPIVLEPEFFAKKLPFQLGNRKYLKCYDYNEITVRNLADNIVVELFALLSRDLDKRKSFNEVVSSPDSESKSSIKQALVLNNQKAEDEFSQVSLLNKKLDEANNLISELLEQKDQLTQKAVRFERYSSAIGQMTRAFKNLKDAYYEDLQENNNYKLQGNLREFCNSLHEIFDSLHSNQFDATCHVTIKIITQNNKKTKSKSVQLQTKTFMRDGRGDVRRSEIDRFKIDHFVNENTAFSKLLSNPADQKYFFANDLLSIPNYQNTHFKIFNKNNQPDLELEDTNRDTIEKRWPLPYKSCIICPISSSYRFNSTIIGFLCVDYDKTNVFTDADVDIVLAFADELFEILNHHIKKYLLLSSL